MSSRSSTTPSSRICCSDVKDVAAGRRSAAGERADRRRADAESEPPTPGRTSRVIILTSGTTGTPKGASRGTQGGVQGAVALLSRMPLRTGDTHAHRRAAVPLVGLLASTLAALRWAARWSLQRKFDPEGDAARDRRAQAARARGGAGDDAADPRRRRRRCASATTRRRCEVVAASGSALTGPLALPTSWTCSATSSTTSTARPRSRSATHRDARAAARRARAPRARRRAGTTVKIFDADGTRAADGRDRAHLRRQRAAVRGLHRRRDQGDDRRADVERRRRPLRRRTACCSSRAATTR